MGLRSILVASDPLVGIVGLGGKDQGASLRSIGGDRWYRWEGLGTSGIKSVTFL